MVKPAKVDLSGLNGLNIDGQINIGQLKYAALDAKTVSLMFNTKTDCSMPALSLKAFGGDIAASGTATTTSSPRISVNPTLRGRYLCLYLNSLLVLKNRRQGNRGMVVWQCRAGDTTALKIALPVT